MEINPLGNDRFQVIQEGRVDVMSLHEVMVLLSQPVESKPQKIEKTPQEQMEEFWASEPWYMTR